MTFSNTTKNHKLLLSFVSKNKKLYFKNIKYLTNDK